MHHEFWLTEADHRLVTERLKGTPKKTPTVQTNSQKLFSALSVVERYTSVPYPSMRQFVKMRHHSFLSLEWLSIIANLDAAVLV